MYIPQGGGNALWQWGQVSMNGTTAVVTFPVTFPAACDVVQFNASALDASGQGLYATGISASGFTVNSPGTVTGTVYWVAIGR
jgi:hypothetical protein